MQPRSAEGSEKRESCWEREQCVWHHDVSEDIQTRWTALKKSTVCREHLNKGFVLMRIVCQDMGWDCNRMHVCCAYGCRYWSFLLSCIYLLWYLMGFLCTFLSHDLNSFLRACLYILSLQCMNHAKCIINSCYILLQVEINVESQVTSIYSTNI